MLEDSGALRYRFCERYTCTSITISEGMFEKDFGGPKNGRSCIPDGRPVMVLSEFDFKVAVRRNADFAIFG